MKRILRTYLSVILLLCLAVELAPLSLMHSHDDHHMVEAGHAVISNSSEEVSDGEYVGDSDHDSSDEDCHICKIQQSLNNQAYTPGKQVGIFNFGEHAIAFLEEGASVDDYLIQNTSGRAPPRA